jgi:hypothetical protein
VSLRLRRGIIVSLPHPVLSLFLPHSVLSLFLPHPVLSLFLPHSVLSLCNRLLLLAASAVDAVGRLAVIGNLSHLVKVGYVKLLRALLVEEDIGFLKAVALAVPFDSDVESSAQPLNQALCFVGRTSLVASTDQSFYGSGERLLDDGVLHDGELEIGDALLGH